MQALKIAYFEMSLIFRSRVFWVVSIFLTVLAWVILEWPLLPFSNPESVISAEMNFLGLLSSLLVIFIVVPACQREFQSGFDIVWSRQFSNYVFLAGKALGIAAAILIAHLPMLLLLSITVVSFYGLQFLPLIGYMFSVVLFPTLAISFSVSLIVSILLRRRLLAYLVLIMLRAGISTQVDIFQLGNFTLHSYYRHPLIGFGPDLHLVLSNRRFYLLLAALLLVVAGLLFPRFAPRQKRTQPITMIALGVFSFISLFGIYQETLNFDNAHHLAALNVEIASPSPNLKIENYALNVMVDLEKNLLSGQAEITITTASESLSELPLSLNPGFDIITLSVNGSSSAGHFEEGKVEFASPIPPQQQVVLSLRYEGTILVNRASYSNMFVMGETPPPLPGGYLGPGTFFLTRSGNWYPLSPLGAPTSLSLTLLGAANSVVINTASQYTSGGSDLNLTWTSPLPAPLFAVVDPDEKMTWPNAVGYVPLAYQRSAKSALSVYINTAFYLDRHLLQIPNPSLQAVVLPLLERTLYDSNTGTLFLSDNVFSDYRLSQGNYKNQPQSLYIRWEAETMARIWWCQTNQCLSMPQYRGSYSVEGDAVTETLLSYLALRLTGVEVGDDFITQEIGERTRVLCTPELAVTLPYPNLGISPPLFIRIHRLWEDIGSDSFWDFTRAYMITYGNAPPTLPVFEDFVRSTTGFSLPIVEECSP